MSAWLIVWSLFFSIVCAQAQDVVLHLRNGDRIAGVVLTETTNQITLSNTWAKALVVPLDQIDRREILPLPQGTSVSAQTTNKIVKVTNIVQTATLPAPLELAKPSRETNSWWKRWNGEIAVGMDLERGATDHSLYHGNVKLAYAQPYRDDPKQFFRNILTYDAAYGKTDGTLSDNRMNGSSKTDFDLSRQIYLYNLGSTGYDEVRRINLRYEEGPGIGYHWITRSNFVVNLELGANYQVEDRSDNTSTKSAYLRLGQDLVWKVNKQMNILEKIEFFPRVGYASEYRMRFETTLSYALLLNVSLNFSVIDLYDTLPAMAVPNNDFQLRTSLGVKF